MSHWSNRFWFKNINIWFSWKSVLFTLLGTGNTAFLDRQTTHHKYPYHYRVYWLPVYTAYNKTLTYSIYDRAAGFSRIATLFNCDLINTYGARSSLLGRYRDKKKKTTLFSRIYLSMYTTAERNNAF